MAGAWSYSGTLWAGILISSVFQIRLDNPTLTLSLTPTQTPQPQLTISWLALGHSTLWSCVCVARVLLRLSLTLTQTPLPQLTNSWLVLGDSILWAGFVPSSVFQLRLANPTLTLSLRLTQTPLPQLTARSQFKHPVVCLCVRAARTLVLSVDSKMVGFHGKPLCFCGSDLQIGLLYPFCLQSFRQIWA